MIMFDFDAHVCTVCSGKKSHQVGQAPVDPSQPRGDFNLVCTACGDTDGPYAGPRSRTESGRHIQEPTR